MSGKLDQSLDQIMSDNKTSTGKGGRRARPVRKAKKTSTAAPVGGIQKKSKIAKAANGPKPAAALVAPSRESKIIVSNLPVDVSEAIIKDFFNKSIGHVKRVTLSFMANGQSRGEASVVFSKSDAAVKAYQEFNTVKVDNRPMKIEVVAAVGVPSLQDRINKPKPVENKKEKPTTKGANANGNTKPKPKKGKKSGSAGRPKRKTAEELDAEMQDYWGAAEGANGAATNGAAAPAVAANVQVDSGMVDEVM